MYLFRISKSSGPELQPLYSTDSPEQPGEATHRRLSELNRANGNSREQWLSSEWEHVFNIKTSVHFVGFVQLQTTMMSVLHLLLVMLETFAISCTKPQLPL